MLRKYLLNNSKQWMTSHSLSWHSWFNSISKEKVLYESQAYLNLLDFLTCCFYYILKEIILNIFNTDASYEFINIVREHHQFKEFISENAALDYFASRCNGMQFKILERKYFEVQWILKYNQKGVGRKYLLSKFLLLSQQLWKKPSTPTL